MLDSGRMITWMVRVFSRSSPQRWTTWARLKNSLGLNQKDEQKTAGGARKSVHWNFCSPVARLRGRLLQGAQGRPQQPAGSQAGCEPAGCDGEHPDVTGEPRLSGTDSRGELPDLPISRSPDSLRAAEYLLLSVHVLLSAVSLFLFQDNHNCRMETWSQKRLPVNSYIDFITKLSKLSPALPVSWQDKHEQFFHLQ